MKNKFIIFITAVFLLQNFSQLINFVSFNLNRTEIIQLLCENKDKPSLHCNGKCYLIKQLKETEEKEKRILNLTKIKELYTPFAKNKAGKFLFFPTVQLIDLEKMNAVFNEPDFYFEISHPPCLKG